MKSTIIIFLVLCFLPITQAQDRLASILSSQILTTASYSYYAIDASTGQVMAESSQLSLVPASVMKIATTGAALEILGPDYKFKTILGYTGSVSTSTGILKGNLIIKGGCDPAFYSKYFPDFYKGTYESWAARVKNYGIKRIKGNLVVDVSAMTKPTIPGAWVWEDIGNYYATGVSALSYFDNLYEIHFDSPDDIGALTNVRYTEPEIEGLNLQNLVVSSVTDSDLSRVYGAPLSYQQVVLGTIPKKKRNYIVRAAAPDPAVSAASVFRKTLLRYGVTVEGKIIKQSAPAKQNFEFLAEKLSPELKDIIVPLNQKSINLFAEQLLREIGRAKNNDPSLDSSIGALSDFWNSKGIFNTGFFPADGSGLSRSGNMCPRTVVEMLYYLYNSPNRDLFFNSLPIAGVTGTLQHSFIGSELQNNLRAKTGTLNRVRSLAGLFTSKSGKKIIFALIINNYAGNFIGVQRLAEDFLGELYNTLP